MVNSNGMRHMLGKFTLLPLYMLEKVRALMMLYFGGTLNENLIPSDL
jgi:hypothetical protein